LPNLAKNRREEIIMFGRRRNFEEKSFETDINRVVTPMLDMTFQLLFYFVINFRPAIVESQVDVSLRSEAPGAPEMFEAFNEPDEYRIFAYTSSGSIDLLVFQMKSFDTEPLSKEDMFGDLKAKLMAIPKPAEGSKSKPPAIKILFDKRLKYSELMQIMNICREQGFRDVGVMPMPKKGAATQ
jgi:biopolymer transport protein ExbD